MRVAFDGRAIADHYPGIARYAFNLARALAALAEVTLIFDPEAANTRYDVLRLPVARRPLAASLSSLGAARRVTQAIAASRAHVFHLPYFALLPPPLIAPEPCPYVATFYDLTPLARSSGYSFVHRQAIRGLHWYVGRVAERMIVLSRAARSDFEKRAWIEPARLVIIPPGVDGSFHPRSPAEVEALHRRLGLPGEYLLYVGSNRPHKNLPRLIRAFARLPKDGPPLILAGKEEARFPQTRREVERLNLSGCVHFLGPIAERDLSTLYSGATLFVFPSLEEGFGLPVLEAMACGAPVACSTAPGLDEAAGEAAVRFDPRNVEAMTDALARLLANKDWRSEIGRRGLAHAAEFTWERAASETMKVYEEAIGEAERRV